MSRQIRRQIPQKQKKKRVDRNACLLVFILIFSGILTFLLLTARDNSKLNSTLDETFDFVKNRIESYEIYNTNDQVKSLVRLLDKTTELSRVIEQEGNLSTEMLDEYAREQRLTGILVLDQNLKVTEQSAKDGDTMSLWQKLIKSDYVRDIAEHPEKTYTTRLRNKGKIYDFAAVARQDAAGILIIYAQKEEVNELNGDLTMASLFSDFPFEMNGSVVICDDDKVVSTNRQELTARSIEEAKSQYKNKFEVDENGIVHLRSETGNWFGRREKIKDYDAYIFFPESQVYITRNIICVIYVLLALLLFLLYRVNRSRTEKRSILQDQKRLRVINALGHAYASISLVNLKTEEIEILKSSGNMKPDQKGDMLFKAHQEELIRQVIAEPFQKAYWEFVDISTVAKRLEERETLSFTARTVDERWMTMIIVPQGYDKDGKLCTVLVAIRDATEEKEREIAQDRNLRNALAAAEHANRAKTVFLNNMSHDIRTPMNAVIGFTALATTHIDNKELVLDYLKKIHISGQHLLSLINDVLDMSRIENGSVRIEYTVVHLPDILHDLNTIIQESVHSKQQELYIDTQDVLHEDIITDKLRLTQVLLNISSNAVKFTPVGGTVNIRVSEKPCRRDGCTTVVFSVKDNGIGMSEEFQKKMDRLLKQAKRKQERKGAWRATKRLFVVATTVVTAFACILMPVQAVQEAVVSTVLNWRDQFVEILYSKEDDPNAVILLQNVELTYLPEGFTETPSNRTSNTSFWNEYQSENGEWLTVRILPIQDKQSTFVDDEYTHYYQISFDGIDAVLGSTIDGSNVLVWQNDGLTYQVSSSCDLSEIISVAEGIKLDSSSNG